MNALKTILDIQSAWATKRDYRDTLHSGPIMQGTFTGWFHEELTLCESFGTAIKILSEEQELKDRDYPALQKQYLDIVNESDRKPPSLITYAGQFLLMAGGAIGFSLILAGQFTSTNASSVVLQQYSTGTSIVIAVFALYFADRIGRAVYRQGYANAAHRHAPGNSLARTTNRTLGIEDDLIDDAQLQSLRIINRSDFVNDAAAAAQQRNKLIPRFPTSFWIYVAGVALVGMMLLLTGNAQIDEHYTKALQSASQTSDHTNDLMIIEAVEKEKIQKRIAVLVVVINFFMAQAMGIVLAAHRGFASNYGEKAYRDIRAFHAKYGDISLEQWRLALQAEAHDAVRVAEETLKAWQLGLQTTATSNAMPVPNEAFFAECIGKSNSRTYAAYLDLKAQGSLI